MNGELAVIALAGDGLLLVEFEQAAGEQEAVPVTERIPLTPAPALRLRHGWREDTSDRRVQGSVQFREWTVTWPHGRVVTFESIAARHGGFGGGPDAADAVARVLAERLGWELPR